MFGVIRIELLKTRGNIKRNEVSLNFQLWFVFKHYSEMRDRQKNIVASEC